MIIPNYVQTYTNGFYDIDETFNDVDSDVSKTLVILSLKYYPFLFAEKLLRRHIVASK